MLNPRLGFGEPNETMQNAFLLDLGPGTFEGQGAITKADDHDYFKTLTNGDFGSCLQFTVLPSADGLVFSFYRPGGGERIGLIYTDSAKESKWWICLQHGVEMIFSVTLRRPFMDTFKFYNFTISTHNIPVGIEGGKLTEPGRNAYMCPALNHEGDMVAHWDLFSFDHSECQSDCVKISKPMQITFFREDSAANIRPGNIWFCNSCQSGELGCDDYTGYVKIFHPDHSTHPNGDGVSYDLGELPEWCTSPYFINFGHNERPDCTFGDCQVGCD